MNTNEALKNALEKKAKQFCEDCKKSGISLENSPAEKVVLEELQQVIERIRARLFRVNEARPAFRKK